MEKWEYLRLTVSYDGEKIHSAVSNEAVIFNPSDNAAEKDLQNHITSLGNQGWELVTVFENHLMKEIFHFKRPIA
jgi:hypothetical protein